MSKENILELWRKKIIDKEEFVVLNILVVEKYRSLIPLIQIGEELNIKNLKTLLNELQKKKILTVRDNQILLLPVDALLKERDNIQVKSSILTVANIDEIRIILNREITNSELRMLRTWIETGQYSFEEIKDAIYRVSLKGIDNFTYIGKVLENSEVKKMETFDSKVDREFDFFK